MEVTEKDEENTSRREVVTIQGVSGENKMASRMGRRGLQLFLLFSLIPCSSSYSLPLSIALTLPGKPEAGET